MAFVRTRSIQTRDIGSSNVLTRAVGDAYAVDGFEPELAFDFTGETYRTDGSATTFSGAMTHSATSLGTMVDGYGPELVTNGDFDTDTNWTKGTGWTISGGRAYFSNSTGTALSQTGLPVMTAGKVYVLTFDLDYTSGYGCTVGINVGGGIDTFGQFNSTGTHTSFVVPTVNRTGISIAGIGNSILSLDNISVREVPAIKWRPHNLLTYSEDFSNASWSKTNSTISSNVTTSPSGTLSADKIIPANLATNGNTAKSVSVSAATYTLSFYAKADDQSVVSFVSNMSGTFRANIFNLSTGVATQATDWEAKMIDVGNGWWRCIATAVAASASSYTFQIGNNSTGWTGDGTSGVYIWGAHLYRSDLGGMVDNPDRGDSYVPTTSAAVYLPRRGHYVYNGQEWTNRGLLLESEARTNLLTYSEDFTNVAWAATSSTVTLDVTGPDGQANSAATLLPSSGSAYHFVRYSTGSISTTYTLSVFAKANGYDFLIIGDNLASGAGNQRIAFFDLSNGSVGTIDDNSTGNVLSTTIEDVGNGWYRCSVTYVASSALHDIGVSDSDGASSFTANGTSSILIYGAQLEAGSTPSSYMPTNGATFTRAAETLTVAAADLPSTITPIVRRAALVTAGWTIIDGGAV